MKRTTRKTRLNTGLHSDSTDPSSSPMIHSLAQHTNPGIELNSSPIRATKFSSPIPKKKSVAFSDDLGHDMMSSPIKGDTPRKSILKLSNLNNLSPVTKNVNFLDNIDIGNCHDPQFWQQGNIVQLQNNLQLNKLLDGCIAVLSIPSFQNRFEVYATLNNVSKNGSWNKILLTTNHSLQLKIAELKLTALCKHIKEDILHYENQLFGGKENITGKSDPFTIRVVAQALKLFNYFMIDEEVNDYLQVDMIQWIYSHASSMLVKPMSKVLILPYLLVIKECNFTNKRRKLIFQDSSLLENMLASLINMPALASSSIMTEKFLSFRNFVNNFPGIMGKNINHWLGILIIQVLSLPTSFTKCIATGVNTLLEVAKVFLGNRNAMVAAKLFCGSPIPLQQIQNFSEPYSTYQDSWGLEDVGIDFVIAKIEGLVKIGQFKIAMDTWLAITLLVGSLDPNFEKWTLLKRWLSVHKSAFASDSASLRLAAISSWRAVIYNVCQNELNQVWKIIDPVIKDAAVKDKFGAISDILQPKIKLLTYAVSSINIKLASHEELDAIHNLNLMLVYSLMNSTNKVSSKYLHLFWDKIIHHLFQNLYFQESNPYLHSLGLKLFTRFLQHSLSTNNINNLRCLINEEISLTEINSLPPRWVHSRSEKLMQSLVLAFELKSLEISQKFNLLNSFLNNVKLVTKKEITPSDISSNLVDNLSRFVDVFKINPIPYPMVYSLIISLHDTFDPDLLVTRGSPSGDLLKNTFYYCLLSTTISNMSTTDIDSIVLLILSSISDKYIVKFLVEIYHLESKSENIKKIAVTKLTERRIVSNSSELLLYCIVCRSLSGEEVTIIVRKLFQIIIDSGDVKKYFTCLKADSWSQDAFEAWLLLARDSQNNEIRDMMRSSLNSRLENNNGYVLLIKFMIQNNFAIELFLLKDKVQGKLNELEGFERFEFGKLWYQYVLFMRKTEENNPWTVEAKINQNLENNVVKLDNLNAIVNNNRQNDKLDESLDERSFTMEEIETPTSSDYQEDHVCIEIFDVCEDSLDKSNILPVEDIKGEVMETDELSLTTKLDSVQNGNVVDDAPIPEIKTEVTETNELILTNKLNSELITKGESVADNTPIQENTQSVQENANETSINNKNDSIVSNNVNGDDKPSKSKSKGKKKKLKSKSPTKSPGPTHSKKPSFDIHSFTAMLSAKLAQSPKEPVEVSKKAKPSKRARQRANKKEQRLAGNPETKSTEIQVQSSFDDKLVPVVDNPMPAETVKGDNLKDLVIGLNESSSSKADTQPNLRRSSRKRSFNGIEPDSGSELETKKRDTSRARTRSSNKEITPAHNEISVLDSQPNSVITPSLMEAVNNDFGLSNESTLDAPVGMNSIVTEDINKSNTTESNDITKSNTTEPNERAFADSPEALTVAEKQPDELATPSPSIITQPKLPVVDNLKQIGRLIENTSDEHIRNLTPTEKYEMESQLMEFMLRIRKS